jgi:sugar phosphate isomerase/epimerase
VKTIKGPAVFLAQFAGGGPHLQNLNDMAKWAKECGFIGVQLPSWDGRVMDLRKAAESKTYCDELRGTMAKHGIEPTELSAHLQGQLVAVHPAYDLQFDNFAPAEVHGNPKARQAWAVQQMEYVAKASRNLGLTNVAAFPGALAWPYLYPWPQRPPGLIEARSTNSRSDGSPSSTFSRRTGRTAASKCTRARTSSTARRSRCFSSA